jgi:hypothetical protein
MGTGVDQDVGHIILTSAILAGSVFFSGDETFFLKAGLFPPVERGNF